MSTGSIEKYLSELTRELTKRGINHQRVVKETRDHLLDAAEQGICRGLTEEAAEAEAVTRFGPAKMVAAKFSADRYRNLDRMLLAAAIALGIAIAYVDSRPHWDDTGITAFSMLLSAGILSLTAPRRPWLWALSIGIWIPLHGILRAPSFGSLGGGLLILMFPTVGAYAGAALRRVAGMVWGSQRP